MSAPRPIERLLFVRTSKPELQSIVPPLGILYLIGALRRELGSSAPAVQVIDYGLERLDRRLLVERIERFDPQLVAISGLTAEAGLIGLVARAAREGGRRRLVVAGGPHASSDPGDLLASRLVDLVAVGEAEETFPQLLRCLRDGGEPAEVPGLVLPGAAGPRFAPARPPLADLDRLPDPAWEAIDLRRYASPSLSMSKSLRRRPYAPIMTSRGCPFGCVYCHKYFGRRVRARSPGHVLAEMHRLHRDQGVREFHLLDDYFNFDLPRAKEICRRISRSGMKVSLAFPNGIRGDRLDAELLAEMKRAGAYKIYFAIESGSPHVQRRIGKHLDLEAIARNIDLARRAGITTVGFFMLGFPGETREEMEATARFAARSRLHGANFFKVVPYPGTELARIWAETYGPPPPGGRSGGNGGGRRDYDDFFFTTRSLPAPPERLRLVDEMYVRCLARFYRAPLRLPIYWLRHPNKGMALRTLWGTLRNIGLFYRDRWSLPGRQRPGAEPSSAGS